MRPLRDAPRPSALPRVLSLFCSLFALSSCANTCAPAGREGTVGKKSAPAPQAMVDRPLLLEPAPLFATALRKRDFAQAAALMDSESEERRALPELRYARALVATELGDTATALRLLDGLDVVYPALAEETRSARDAAIKKSKDITLLQAFLGKSEAPEDVLALAQAAEHHGDFKEAELRALEALSRLTHRQSPAPPDAMVAAHALLARLYEQGERPAEAAKEYFWLATEAPLSEGASGADRKLANLRTAVALTSEQRLARAKLFSARGLVESTESELLAAQSAPGARLPPATVLALRAWAYFNSRTAYERAAELFREAAALSDANRQEYLYHEAKSLSRAHQDASAIEKYETLSRQTGLYAEHAFFQVARLYFIDGQFDKAVRKYEAYAKAYKRGRYEKSWRAELPIARLALGQAAAAEKEIQDLFNHEKDELTRARWLELLGVAAQALGKNPLAIARFSQVIQERPLSYPALLASARLRALGQPEPPPIGPATPVPSPPELVLELPDKVRRLHSVGLDEAAEEALRSEEGALKGLYGARSGEALCRLYSRLEIARRRYQVAQTAASWSVLKYEATPGTAWQPDCIYPRPYSQMVNEQAKLHAVPAAFVYGVMRQESAFRPNVVSSADAVGLMQIIPSTAQRIAKELNAPYEASLMKAPAVNIRFGVYYLRKLLDAFGGRLDLAAAAYNAGPHAVSRWLDKGEQLPADVFVARIPYEETRNYVYRVLGNTARYAHLEGGSAAVPKVELDFPQGLRAPSDAY